MGASTNSVAWPLAGNYATFSFNNLALNYTTKYYALLSTSPTSVGGALTGRTTYLYSPSIYSGGGMVANGLNYQASNDLVFTASFQTTPEPGTLVLLAIGMLGLLAYAWRKRK